jgi:hypothetical protein
VNRPLCAHPDFEANVLVNRLEDVGRFSADIHVRCATCGVRFRWLGLEMGLDPARPMTSVDGFELRAPLEPDAHLTSLMAGWIETQFPASPPTRQELKP